MNFGPAATSALPPLRPSFPPPAQAARPTASPFALTAGCDDTALFRDARAGFSHLLPGRPILGVVTPHPSLPLVDAILRLQDAPITIRYRFEPPGFAAASAGDLAYRTAERVASERAHARVPAAWANDSWLSAWGVEAAAVATYDVLPHASGGIGLAREDLFVLVRGGMVMIVSWLYPRDFVDDPAYVMFAAVAETTMVWDTSRWDQRGRVWPESTLLERGLTGKPSAKLAALGDEVGTLPLLADERTKLLVVLAGITSGAGAPWTPLTPPVIEGHTRAILAAVREPRLRALVCRSLPEARTAHDLRGLAIVMTRALEPRPAHALPSVPPPLPPRARTVRAVAPPRTDAPRTHS